MKFCDCLKILGFLRFLQAIQKGFVKPVAKIPPFDSDGVCTFSFSSLGLPGIANDP
jgi:hypothetical protein